MDKKWWLQLPKNWDITSIEAVDDGRAACFCQQNKSLSIFNVAALGIGAMVGAGIFALLGQAALLVHSATWLSFAAGGVIALFSGYAYSCLGAFYPSRGGIIDFFGMVCRRQR